MSQRLSTAALGLAAVVSACTLWFGNYTLPARRAVANALSVARQRGHDAIHTEDFLLGLLAADPELHERVRSRVGFGGDAIQLSVDRVSPARRDTGHTPTDLPLAPDLKDVLDKAAAGATGRITTKELLLALVKGPGLAGQVLRELGVTEDVVLAVAETDQDA